MKFVEFAKHKMIGTTLGAQLARGRSALLARRARNFGVDGDILLESELFEQAQARLIGKQTHCIDVGAHLGSVISRFVALAPAGLHTAIEPVPYKARWLAAKLPGVAVHQVALGAHAGQAEFFVPRGQSGFGGLRVHGDQKGRAQLDVLVVSVVPLDSLIPLEREIGFIKLDVEGGELAALRGGQRLLARCRPYIQFECTETALQAHGVLRRDIYEFLHQQDYDIYLVKAWLEGREPLTYAQLDRAMTFPFQAFNFLAAPRSRAS